MVWRSGGDAIGLNFFPPSVRYVDPQAAETGELSKHANDLGLLCVGVFVNTPAEIVAGVAHTLELGAVQLHGDESVELARELVRMGLKVIRAVKLPRTPLDVSQIDESAKPWAEMGCHLLFDADAGSSHGGSGKTLHWESLSDWASKNTHVRWTLAGGLRPENVKDAIQVAAADSIDTASGVECPKGVKNGDRIESFCQLAGEAFGQ